MKNWSFLIAVLLGGAMSCTEPTSTPAGIPAGIYDATTYLAGPTPSNRLDMLALGVDWTLTIGQDRSVISHWHVDNGVQVSDVSYTGTVSLQGATATFNMNGADQILAQRTWTLQGDQLVAENQTVADVNATIRFTRR